MDIEGSQTVQPLLTTTLNLLQNLKHFPSITRVAYNYLLLHAVMFFYQVHPYI